MVHTEVTALKCMYIEGPLVQMFPNLSMCPPSFLGKGAY